MKFKPYLIAVFAATSVGCVFVPWGIPVTAQESEIEEAPIEATIEEAIPEEAETTKNPTVQVEDLKLLVKPFTLKELENEAAAWLLLLKEQVREISNAEVVIKRGNRVIDAEEAAAKQLKDANLQFAEAQQKLAKAKPNTFEAEQATQAVAEAQTSLRIAQASAKAAAEATAKLQQNQAVRDILEKVGQEQAITQTQGVLEAAQQALANIPPNSPRYEELTAKIANLQASVATLEQAEIDLGAKIPDSPAYNEAKKQVKKARQRVNDAFGSLTTTMPELLRQAAENTGEITSSNNNAQPNLDEKVEEKVELKNKLLVNVTNLQSQRTEILDRFTVILNELDNKGGDSSSYRQYIGAISGVAIDITDTQGLGVRLFSWLKSDEGGIRWGINLAKFLTIVLVSVILSYLLARFTNRVLTKVGGTSALFREFIVIFVKRGVIVAGFLLGLTSLGISLGPVLALVGGASFVLAFALQNNLGNFASGLMLLINKPFDVGDEVKVAGYWAFVDSISLASTRLKDFGGNLITLPNNTVWGGDIINYTHADVRKLGLAIHVRFTEDLDKVYQMWMDITSSHPKILDNPQPGWRIWNDHYDYYIWINLTAWLKTDDYWSVYVEILKQLQNRIAQSDIELAMPQQEIKLDNLLTETLATDSHRESTLSQVPRETPAMQKTHR